MKKVIKRFILLSVLIVFGLSTYSMDWNSVKSGTAKVSESRLISGSVGESVIRFDLEGYYSDNVETQLGKGLIISGDKMSPNFEFGAPDLPSKATSVIIPVAGGVDLEVIDYEYYDVDNVLIAPSKGVISRQIDPSSVPYIYGDVYGVDAFYPSRIASVGDPFVLRDFRGVTVHFNPFSYNPISKVLRVYTSIEVRVKSNNSLGVNELKSSKAYSDNSRLDSDFSSIYESQFLNFSKSRYTPIEEEGSMLVICYDDFYDAMLPFVKWKNEKGIATEMIKLSAVGDVSTFNIKEYIKNYYEQKHNKYVLLVGDSGQLPSPMSNGGLSDPSYAQIVGDDIYIDVLIGRFSAQTLEHVNTYVTKVLNYEKNPSMEKDWFSTGIGIASREGPGHFNEYDYQHIRKIRTKLLAYNYYTIAELYEGSQGGEDAAGNPTATMLTEKINEGASIINYIGHGDWNMFVTTGFNNTNAKNLENYNMYPFIWSVACINGEFSRDECFAEAWTRNSKNGNPVGAIGFMGSSINQPWIPPMYGQDEMNDILTETYQNNIKRSFGGLSFNGVYKMIETLGAEATATANTWNCFGDPSVVVRTSMPEQIAATVPETSPLGSATLNVSCLVEGALVCATTADGKILSKSQVVGGVATLDISSIQSPCEIKVTVSKYNTVPFQSTVEIKAMNEAFITVKEFSLIDNGAGANNDGILNPGETAKLKITLLNNGGAACTSPVLTVSCDDSSIEMSKPSVNLSTIQPDGTIEVTDIEIKALNSIVDKMPIKFVVKVTSGSNNWNNQIVIIPQAPKMDITKIVSKNSNGASGISAGETGYITVTAVNNGSVIVNKLNTILSSSDEMITVIEGNSNVESVPVGGEVVFTYKVKLSADSEYLYNANLSIDYTADNYDYIADFKILMAKRDVLVINMSKNELSSNAISAAIEGVNEMEYSPVVYDKSVVIDAAEINKYKALFIVLGISTNSTALDDAQGLILANFLNAGGSIYMEGGDTWSYNKPTPVHPMFGISKGSDGFNDLSNIKSAGANAMFDDNFYFNYVGENKYIDRVGVIEPAFAIFKNESPEYITGVANKTDVYSTIGTSFAFEGLKDNGEINNKAYLMSKYLNFFGLLKKPTGVNEVTADNIAVYPNPSVDGKFSVDGEYNSVKVYDFTGRIVLESGVKLSTIDISNLNSGVYIFRFATNNGTEIAKKVIVK